MKQIIDFYRYFLFEERAYGMVIIVTLTVLAWIFVFVDMAIHLIHAVTK